MIIILAIGGMYLLASFIFMKLMEKYHKKWIEVIMALTMIIEFLCIGIVSCTQIESGGEIRMKP